jgi:hypothetical protein
MLRIEETETTKHQAKAHLRGAETTIKQRQSLQYICKYWLLTVSQLGNKDIYITVGAGWVEEEQGSLINIFFSLWKCIKQRCI